MDNFIPVYKPSLSGNERKYVLDCLDSTWISSKGKYINEFEEKFADYINVKHATSVCNGTVAIHLALMALGIGPGDEVIVPAFTYIASVNSVTYTGAKAVYVESLPDSWQMDPADVRRKITSRTKAIMAVHLYGHPCKMDELVQICKDHQLYLVEDCAEGLATKFDNQHVGGFGDISAFSFFGNKTITTGEGGMVVTNNKELHEKAAHIKNQGVSKSIQYWHDIVGYNYRMTNIAAAIGLAQLEQIDRFVEEKRRIAEYYQKNIDSARFRFHAQCERSFHSYWMCSILVENGNRNSLRNELSAKGIETRPLFFPVYKMPPYLDEALHFPIAERIGASGINLPSFPALTDSQLERIVEAVNNSTLS
jgi:perosamine synthetase